MSVTKVLVLMAVVWLTAMQISYSQACAGNISIPASGSCTTCSANFFDTGGSGGNYSNGENRTYTICPGTAGQAVRAVFSAFATEGCCDFLTIYNGSSTSSPIIGTYSGTTSPGTITATNPSGCLTFRFTSDGSVNAAGWNAAISCVALTTTSCPANISMPASGLCFGCSSNFYDSGGAGGNYGNNQNRTVTFCPATVGQNVQLAFTSFGTESCCDFLRIYDGGNVNATLIGTYSGTNSPGTVVATNASGCLTVNFTSDGSVADIGWAAAVSCVTPLTPGTCGSVVNMPNTGFCNTCSTTFYDGGGASANYGNNEAKEYTFCPSTAGQVVQLNFTSFSTEGCCDFLTIYNGNSTAAPIIGTFSGTGSPGTIASTSSDGCLTIRFTSDGSISSTGWVAALSCVAPTVSGGCAGNISMPASGTCNTCSANFYDTGGSGGSYNDNESRTYTICPASAGSFLQVSFTAFSTESCCDFLTIYDGNSVASPVIGTFSGTALPGTIVSTHATGCLTFRFVSDGSVTSAGWAAVLSCSVPCQTINANLVSTNPVATSGIIKVCQGQSINFVGSGTFSSSSVGATYSWSMGNGTNLNGTNISYSYNTPGNYFINLNITDPQGCNNQNLINQQVQVSTNPTITTSAAPDPLCAGQESLLTGSAVGTPFNPTCAPPVSGTTFLPDGSGVSYSTSIVVDCYTVGQTINSATDIQNICLNMEHSYLGDLSMRIICPNGQSMLLKAYPGGGGTYLGNPIDDVTSGPGTGFTYCFTPAASTLLVNGPTVTSGTPAGNSIQTGNYMPVDGWANLNGCPLNGNWTIQVTDNLFSDDGYIFFWDMNFNPSFSVVTSFTPTIVSTQWLPAANLVQNSSTQATVTPLAMGTPCYTFQVTDNFGCTYTQNQCLDVNCTVLPIELLSFNATQLSSSVLVEWETASEVNTLHFDVERSDASATNWAKIGEVAAAGNSSTNIKYQFTDNLPLEGVSFYRLRQVDQDMSFELTDPAMVNFQKWNAGQLVAYPNPTDGIIQITAENFGDITEWQMYNSIGQRVNAMVGHHQLKSNAINLDVSRLPAGAYHLITNAGTITIIKN